MQYTKKEDTEDGLSVADTTNGIDPDWVTADRVIAQQDRKGGFSTPGYLCYILFMLACWVYVAVCMIGQLRAKQPIATCLCHTSGKYAAKHGI